jgi:HSP20 family protein
MNTETKQEVAVSTKPSSEIAETLPSNLFSPMREVERLFDRFMPHAWMRPMSLEWPAWGGLEESFKNLRMPRLDVVDRDKEVLIRVELPGVDKKDVDVSVNESVLVIKGSVRRESEKEKEGYFRREIAQSDFSRSLALPGGVDASKISASLTNGILEIVLPKDESVQRRTVEVK